jgi:hypothetical protein
MFGGLQAIQHRGARGANCVFALPFTFDQFAKGYEVLSGKSFPATNLSMVCEAQSTGAHELNSDLSGVVPVWIQRDDGRRFEIREIFHKVLAP